MITMDEMGVLLDEVAAELPEDLYKKLNGGVVLMPQRKLHTRSVGDSLYVMGEYHSDRALGRYITIYYGSFMRIYGNLPVEALKEELRKTLKHEFRHHLESLAGDRSLEIRDAQELREYLEGMRKRMGE